MVGTSFAHYEILAKLGEGGMGEVYQARDRRLQRIVALKILPKEAVANPDRRRRFEQEARAASALSHPNIVTIYDIAQADGLDYIAMEHVEGKPLDRLIGRKGLRIQDVLHYAVQIAGALSAAHAAGIVHRDVKPANIMVTASQQVKLLDFGVAKLIGPDEPDEANTQSLTVNLPNTDQGVILGTVAYMSPEQAEGRPIDCRSDIFSFGSVLYEMLTGRRAFEGETKLSTIMAIVQKDPRPVSEILGRAPLEIEKIIARCLRKDRERRLQHMDDVRNLLVELKEESDSGLLVAHAPVAPPPRRRSTWRWALAGAAALAAASAFFWLPPLIGGKGGELVLTRLTSEIGVNGCATLSADGRVLAYCSDRAGEDNLDIWVRHLGGGSAIRLTRDARDDVDPAFSPDGGLIAFRSERNGGGVYIVPTLGGGERPVAPGGLRPRFSPDGKWLAYWTGQPSGLDGAIYVVAAGGGTPRRLQPEFHAARWPVWSPDGRHLLFWGLEKQKGTAADWFVAPVEGGPAIPTHAFAALREQRLNSLPQVAARQYVPSHWTRDGVYFAAALAFGAGYNTNIFRLPLTGSFRPGGPAVRLTFGSDLEMDPYAVAGPAIVFSRYARGVDVWGLPLAVNQGKPAGDFQQLTRDGLFLALSPSASRAGKLAYASYRSGNASIYLIDLASGVETQIAGSEQVGSPAVSPDGSSVAYTRTMEGRRRLEVVPASGGSPRVLCDDCGWVTDWSSDGKSIAYRRRSAPGIGLIDVESGSQSELLVNGGEYIGDARFSPDGRWVAFLVRPGRRASNLRIAPFRAGGSPPAEWMEATRGEQRDYLPAWSPDSALLYFLSDRDGFRCIWAQRIVPATGRPSGAPFPIRHLHSPRRSLMELWDPTSAGLSAIPGRLILSQAELSGEVWMAAWRQPKRK